MQKFGINSKRCPDNANLFYHACLAEPDVAGKILYKDFSTGYRWDKKRKWVFSTRSRIVHVPLQDPERFYLRLLLCYRRGPTSLEDLMTIDNVMYPAFHEAAMSAGYLENDLELEECLLEASYEPMPYPLRQTFGTILVYALPGSPLGFWERFISDLSEDVQRELGMDADDREVGFKILRSLDNILRVNVKTLENYGLPTRVQRIPIGTVRDHGSKSYKIESEQQDIFDQIISAVESPKVGQKLCYLDGPGGTGKSFLFEQWLAKDEQRTRCFGFHSSQMKTIDQKGEFNSTSPINYLGSSANDAPFEAVDRTFRDIMDNDREPFGGKGIVFSGYHRQMLSVLKDATRAETLMACFKASPLWRHLKQVQLFENMRVRTARRPDNAAKLAEFSEFML
ncbi:Helitron helicase [Phytophthora megakarya]|uniref:ATP-dependent DNA helicase n=1 Tax=Phytophthora megakarya TaxID=4795 RepID=A0A225WAY7_9STRA|nr:Helitron helicase [Phytophthora megakarya]